MEDRQRLRALERAVLRWSDQGLAVEEIARRFRRSPDHIRRIISYTELPGRRAARSEEGLRPLERVVLSWRERGATHDELADMFQRSPQHMRRVEGLAYLRKGLQLLG